MKKVIGILLACLLMVSTVAGYAEDEKISFENESYQVLVKKTITLKPGTQGIEEKLKYEWESSNPEIAKVKAGKVTGVAAGTATITCTATGKSEKTYTAQCTVEVLQPVTKITTAQKKVELPSDVSFSPEITVEPENATIKNLEWSTSNPNVIMVFDEGVFKDGRIRTTGAGKATLTGKATDGSGKSVKITVTVPKVYVTQKKITITDPKGVEFGYQYNVSGFLTMGIQGDAISTDGMDDKDGLEMMRLIPQKAGTSSIIFTVNGRKALTVKVTVEKSALSEK